LPFGSFCLWALLSFLYLLVTWLGSYINIFWLPDVRLGIYMILISTSRLCPHLYLWLNPIGHKAEASSLCPDESGAAGIIPSCFSLFCAISASVSMQFVLAKFCKSERGWSAKEFQSAQSI